MGSIGTVYKQGNSESKNSPIKFYQGVRIIGTLIRGPLVHYNLYYNYYYK